MKTAHLKTLQISDNALEWLGKMYTAVDKMDAGTYRTFMSADCQLQFGNNPVLAGHTEIIGGIQQFWDSIAGLDHDFLNIWGADNHFAAEALIEYTRKDGSTVPIPCVTTIRRNPSGLASLIRIFIDTKPIFDK